MLCVCVGGRISVSLQHEQLLGEIETVCPLLGGSWIRATDGDHRNYLGPKGKAVFI